MPIITVKTNSTADITRTFARVAERLTESTVRVLKKEKDLVAVNFESADSNSAWFVGGTDTRGKENTHWEVSIKVTLGTNTMQQKSTWIREAFETISQEMGEPASPLYITIDEVDSENWGYDGLTQSARKLVSA